MSTYHFIVDTEQYAGNWERELCAYITGLLGDCGVGSDMSVLAMQEIDAETALWFEGHVEQDSDDHGCRRPVKLHPTPGWYNDGNGNHHRGHAKGRYPAYLSIAITLDELPTPEVFELMTQRAHAFATDRPDSSERAPFTVTDVRIIKMTMIEEQIDL